MLELIEICDGVKDWCALVWLVATNDASVAQVRPILRKFAAVVDALSDFAEGAPGALAAHSASGLATLHDTGVRLARLSMRTALRLTPGVDALPATNGVAYRFFYQPTQNARRIMSIDALERLKELSGVESLFPHYLPDSEIDARDGTRCYLGPVVGSAAD